MSTVENDMAVRVREIIEMAQDDEACFEGLGIATASSRRRAEAFRQLHREVTKEMLSEAGSVVGISRKENGKSS